jgi:hypothetical protein
MNRIFPFLATNLAVLGLLSLMIFIIERVFGVHLRGGGLGGRGEQRPAAQYVAFPDRSGTGHEITHVANGDMVTLALLQGVLNRKAE